MDILIRESAVEEFVTAYERVIRPDQAAIFLAWRSSDDSWGEAAIQERPTYWRDPITIPPQANHPQHWIVRFTERNQYIATSEYHTELIRAEDDRRWTNSLHQSPQGIRTEIIAHRDDRSTKPGKIEVMWFYSEISDEVVAEFLSENGNRWTPRLNEFVVDAIIERAAGVAIKVLKRHHDSLSKSYQVEWTIMHKFKPEPLPPLKLETPRRHRKQTDIIAEVVPEE